MIYYCGFLTLWDIIGFFHANYKENILGISNN